MRCPKCGYVSFPGLPACKRCGYPLEQVAKEDGPEFLSPPAKAAPLRAAGARPAASLNDEETASGFPPAASNPSEEALSHSGASPPRHATNGPAWSLELRERAANFRRRRTRASENRETNLTLDFDSARLESHSSDRSAAQAEAILERAFEERSSSARRVNVGPVPLQQSLAGQLTKGTPPASFGRAMGAPGGAPNVAQSGSAQLEWASTPFIPTYEGAYREVVAASLQTRFLAGLVDVFVLLVAAGLFAAVFTLAGGRVHSRPIDLGVVLFIAAFWIFLYFGGFTLLAFNTPGQSAMRLTVRNLDGDPPTPEEALLRGFGYVVSVATLMLGFLWAAMDSDGMAWQDHISGTLLVEQE